MRFPVRQRVFIIGKLFAVNKYGQSVLAEGDMNLSLNKRQGIFDKFL